MIRALGAILLLCVSIPARAQERPDLRARVEAHLEPYVRMNHFAGTVLIAHGDDVRVLEAFGLADRALGVPFETDTRFRVGSITKDFTAALILGLQDDGALSTDDPLARFLPDFPGADRITIEHLLTHTDGVPDWRKLPDAAALAATGTSLDEAIAGLARLEPEFEPGAHRLYGSSGYLILGRVIELVTGRSFREALRSRILEPLGLEDTGSLEGLELVPRLADSYVPTGRPPWLRRPAPVDPEITVGSASIWSTATDLFRWSRSAPARRLAWGQGERKGREYLWTSGLTDGFVSRIRILPGEEWTIVLLSNVFTPAFRPIMDDLTGLLFGERVSPPETWEPVVLDAAAVAAFEGRWTCTGGFAFGIESGDEGPSFVVGESRFPLQPRSARVLHLPTDYATITFTEPGPQGFAAARYEGGSTTACRRDGGSLSPR